MHSAFILVSDRVSNGEKQDRITPIVGERLAAAGAPVASAVTIPEGFDVVSEAIRQALADGARVILTAGGTGLKPRNRTPEAALEFIDTRLEGLERHILVQGLQSTKLAGLSRGYVGLTSRNADAALIINAPSSVGGVTDVLDVICPLLDNIWESLAR
ncbi:molybdopterin-binding protein [Corynebacterium matruchotii]|uniref:molybdopterin-binding protein n=1 Tax=Corynebacterium matruchotii TaxID=43768 RepID=UPI00242ACF1A|nr:molybdopterin-binding protein [Corynebacterium matruchotii]